MARQFASGRVPVAGVNGNMNKLGLWQVGRHEYSHGESDCGAVSYRRVNSK